MRGGVVHSFADNQIWITRLEDLSLSVQGSYSYDLHGWMATVLDVGIYDPVSGVFLLSQHQDYNTIDGPPYYGTFYMNANVVLPAGTTWVMAFTAELFAEPRSGSPPGSGIGSLTFEVTPEPAMLSMLVSGLLLSRGRPKSRRAARSRRIRS